MTTRGSIGHKDEKTKPILQRFLATEVSERVSALGSKFWMGNEETKPIARLWREIRSTKSDSSGAVSGCLLPGVIPEIPNWPGEPDYAEQTQYQRVHFAEQSQFAKG